MVNFEEAVKKPFTDIAKLVIGIVLSIIPIVNFIAQGFIIECSGLGKNRPSKNMPEWKEFADFFVKGFVSFIIMIIYAIPAFLVFSVAIGYAAGSLFASFTGVMPEGFRSVMASNGGEQFFSQQWMLALPTLIAVAPFIIIGLLLLIIAAYLSPIATLNYLKNKKFAKAFEFNFVISKAFTLNYFISWLIAGIIGAILSVVLSFIPWIGSSIAFFVSGVIAYSLYGQVFREK